MHRVLVSAMLVTLSVVTACTYRSGNDESLTPVVRGGPNSSASFSISSRRRSQVAVFEPVRESDGWSLRFLGSADSLGLLQYSAPTRLVALGSVIPGGVPRGTQMYYYGMNPLCASGSPLPADKDGRVQLSYDWGCTQFLSDLSIPPAPVIDTWRSSASPTHVWVLVSASTAHLSDQQWATLADSVRVHALASAPGELGRLAFGRSLTARWEVALRELSLRPTTGPDTTPTHSGYELKRMTASP